MSSGRSSNIELCRIVAILLVIIGHAATYTQGDLQSYNTCWTPALFMRGFSVVGVNVFVLISGWFGINVKKESVINLLYIVLFCGVLRCVALAYLGDLNWKNLFVLSTTNWFVIAYLGLLILSPVLNSFVSNCTQRQLQVFLITFFVYQTWMGWFPSLPYYEDFRGGYSILSFVGIYLLSRYFRLYGIPSWINRYAILLYFILSIIIAGAAYINIRFSLPLTYVVYKYNNPIVLLSSVCLFSFFLNLQISKINMINHFAKSSLSVILLHEPQPFHGYIKTVFLALRDGTGGGMIAKWIFYIVAIYLLCVLVDQLRLLTYQMVKKLI